MQLILHITLWGNQGKNAREDPMGGVENQGFVYFALSVIQNNNIFIGVILVGTRIGLGNETW